MSIEIKPRDFETVSALDEFLKTLDVQPSKFTLEGYNLIHYVAAYGDIDGLNRLIELGVEPTAITDDGWNAAHIVAMHSENRAEIISKQLIQGLIEVGVRPFLNVPDLFIERQLKSLGFNED